MTAFSKSLSKTDISNRLSLPANYLKHLPSFKGGYAVTFQAIDEEGKIWTFTCSIRKKGPHLKPVISKGWLAFVCSKKLKVGDKIKLRKVKNEATTHAYEVQAEKEIKVFGAVLGFAPI